MEMIANKSASIPREREPEEEDFETSFYQAAVQPARRVRGVSPSLFPLIDPPALHIPKGNNP